MINSRNLEFGGDSSSVAGELKEVEAVRGTCRAFAALRKDGTVVTWGEPGFLFKCSSFFLLLFFLFFFFFSLFFFDNCYRSGSWMGKVCDHILALVHDITLKVSDIKSVTVYDGSSEHKSITC